MSLKTNLFRFIFISVLGVLLHFTYEWSGDNAVVGLFSAVNDENGYIIPEEFTAKKIIFAVSSEKMSGSEEDPVIEYVYDCTTEQITKVEK